MTSPPRSLLARWTAAMICLASAGHAGASRAGTDDTRDVGMKALNHRLADWGVALSATYIGEVLGNASGGIRRGVVYDGRLDLGVDVDLEKLTGWSGATFHANIYQIHGDGLSRDYVGNLMLVSGIEAYPSTRLYEL